MIIVSDNMRMTKQRKLILNIFKGNKKPLSADLIFSLLPDDAMNLSTVYRTIEKLSDLAIISKSVIDNISYYYLTEGKHHHYLICLNCKEMTETNCQVSNMAREINKTNGFLITSHDLTFYGYCSQCKHLFT